MHELLTMVPHYLLYICSRGDWSGEHRGLGARSSENSCGGEVVEVVSALVSTRLCQNHLFLLVWSLEQMD